MKKLLLVLVLFTSLITHAQNVAINNDASLPHNSAILDIKSGTKGLLIPRMTTAAITAIVNPAKGLLVLDTVKNQLLVNMGTSVTPNWQNIVSSSGWSLTGNAGIDPSTQFIGTLDEKPFLIRVHNFRSGSIDSLFMNASYGFRSLDSVTYGIANTAIGFNSLLRNSTGNHNTGIGWSSLRNNTYGFNNTGVGSAALFSNTSGGGNVAVGTQALYNNTGGYSNTASGDFSLHNNTTGFSNTASGSSTLFYNSTGIFNTAIGRTVLLYNSTGNYNTGLGSNALFFNTSGNNNVAIGSGSLTNNESGYSNVAVGVNALFNSGNRANLVAIGDSALYNNGLGSTEFYQASANTAIGSKALYANTVGYNNTGVGYGALSQNNWGLDNTGIGSYALFLNTTGFLNTAVGRGSLSQNTTGLSNTGIGANSLPANTTGNGNTALGSSSLFRNTTGANNTAIGGDALGNNVNGSLNTGLGVSARPGSANLNNATAIGALSRVDCSNCMVLGAIDESDASNNVNVGIGTHAPDAPLTFGNYIGKKITLFSSGPDSYYGMGIQGGLLQIHSDASGADIAFGYGSNALFTERMRIKGNGRVGIGTSTPTKQFEVVGPASGIPVTIVVANRGGFGPAAIEFVSNYAVADQWRPGYIRSNDLGGYTGALEFYTNGSGIGTLYNSLKGFEVRNGAAYTATGTVGVYSDARLKNNITAFADGLNVISKINPVQFYYNADAPFVTDQQQVGVIAQDLEKIAPYMIEKNKQNGYDDLRSVNNQAYTFILINAVKEQQQQIEVLQKQIEFSNEEVKQLRQQQKQIEISNDKVEKLNQQVDELKKMMEQLLKK